MFGKIKIKNDIVGLLKELGIAIIICFPISTIISISGEIYNENYVRFVSSIIENIPLAIMIVIFMKAKKHLRRDFSLK